ncbi:MAG: PQQ-binding-like beta-propeller repeat protein [Bacteroidia bacterium]|nr:PQQ-binding-like beta-propeller repeat protein [Bacteroidia bacterium]
MLVIFLLPDFIQLPDWTDRFKSIKLVQRWEVLGPVIPLSDAPEQKAYEVLILNARHGNAPLPEIVKNRQVSQKISVLLTYRRIDKPETLWERVLENVSPSQTAHIKMAFDQSIIYLTDNGYLRAINRHTGDEIWYLRLRDRIASDCKNCLRIFPPKPASGRPERRPYPLRGSYPRRAPPLGASFAHPFCAGQGFYFLQ